MHVAIIPRSLRSAAVRSVPAVTRRILVARVPDVRLMRKNVQRKNARSATALQSRIPAVKETKRDGCGKD